MSTFVYQHEWPTRSHMALPTHDEHANLKIPHAQMQSWCDALGVLSSLTVTQYGHQYSYSDDTRKNFGEFLNCRQPQLRHRIR